MNLLMFSLLTIFLIFGGIFLYRFDGRRTLFNIDFVQFVYAFLILPLMFVVLKVFVYQNLSELAILTPRQLFAVDTLFSVLFLYLAAAKTVHAVTKSFSLKVKNSPGFDIFQLSEYLHMWWSHIAMYVLALCILSFVGLTNLLFPFVESELTRQGFWGSLLFGSVGGLFLYIIIWNTKLSRGNFLNFMKFLFGIFFALQAIAYVRLRPSFSSEYLVFWMMFALFLTTVLCSFFLERSRRAQKWRKFFQPSHWGIEGLRE
jgi:hypothetical protein